MDANVFTIIGLVAGFFLLGFISAWAWYNNQLTKLYEEFCDKVDKACGEVASYYEGLINGLPENYKELNLIGFREWLGKQKSSKGQPYSDETIRKYVAKLQSGYSKEKKDSLETTACRLYEKYLAEK